MKWSAKLTAVSFFAALAIGGAAACTFSSGTVDDTDGGTQRPDSGGGEGGGNGDGGGGGDGGGATCEVPNLTTPFTPESCQSCLNAKCCTEMQTCFAITADPDAGTTDCNVYTDCINDCNKDPANDTDQKKVQCYQDLCDITAATGVVNAYDTMDTCKATNCSAECPPQ